MENQLSHYLTSNNNITKIYFFKTQVIKKYKRTTGRTFYLAKFLKKAPEFRKNLFHINPSIFENQKSEALSILKWIQIESRTTEWKFQNHCFSFLQ